MNKVQHWYPDLRALTTDLIIWKFYNKFRRNGKAKEKVSFNLWLGHNSPRLDICCCVSYETVTQYNEWRTWQLNIPGSDSYLIQHWALAQTPPSCQQLNTGTEKSYRAPTQWQRRFRWRAHVIVTETDCYNKNATKGPVPNTVWISAVQMRYTIKPVKRLNNTMLLSKSKKTI